MQRPVLSCVGQVTEVKCTRKAWLISSMVVLQSLICTLEVLVSLVGRCWFSLHISKCGVNSVISLCELCPFLWCAWDAKSMVRCASHLCACCMPYPRPALLYLDAQLLITLSRTPQLLQWVPVPWKPHFVIWSFSAGDLIPCLFQTHTNGRSTWRAIPLQSYTKGISASTAHRPTPANQSR